MRPRAFLGALLVSSLLAAGCFDPVYGQCRVLCGPSSGASGSGCPPGYACVVPAGGGQAVCKGDEVRFCPTEDAAPRPVTSFDAGPPGDAPADAGPPDAAPPDAAPPDAAPPDAALADGPLPAPGDTICVGEECLSLTPAMTAGLLTWLDPSNLPPPGEAVTLWRDRSGRGNDARPISAARAVASAPAGGVDLPFVQGGGLTIEDSPSLRLGNDGFVLLVAARVLGAPPTCLFAKADGADRLLPKVLVLEMRLPDGAMEPSPHAQVNGLGVQSPRTGLADGHPHLFVLHRAGRSFTLRIDGVPEATVTAAPGGVDPDNDRPAVLGTCGRNALPLPAIKGLVLVRGSFDAAEVGRLERFWGRLLAR